MKALILLCIAVTALTAAPRTNRTKTEKPSEKKTAAVQVPGLAAYWCFDEGRGMNIHDLTGNDNDAELMYADDFAPWREGRSNQGIFLNGERAYIDAGGNESLCITNAITVTAWVMLEGKPDEVNDPAVVSTWDRDNDRCSWFLGTEGGHLAAGISPTGAQSDGIVARMQTKVNDRIIGKWMHCAMTFDGTTLYFYLSGRAFGTNSFSEKKPIYYNDATSVYIGRSHGNTADNRSGSRCLRATIDEVRIYSRALRAEEIAAMVLPYAAELKGSFGKKRMLKDDRRYPARRS